MTPPNRATRLVWLATVAALLAVSYAGCGGFENHVNAAKEELADLGIVREDEADRIEAAGFRGWETLQWSLLLFYWFYAMALSCDEYFVPAVEVFCQRFNVPHDVAGATLMALGSGSPEFCTNVISIFITKSPVGVGTIVGSEIFNMLVITGCSAVCSLGGVLHIDWRPFSRDVIFYAISVALLGWALRGGCVHVLQGSVLVGMYIVYVLVCIYFSRISAIICPKRKPPRKPLIAGVEIDEALESSANEAEDEASSDRDSDTESDGEEETVVTPERPVLAYPGLNDSSALAGARQPFLRPSVSAILAGSGAVPKAPSGWLLTKTDKIAKNRHERFTQGWSHYWFYLDMAHKEMLYSDGPLHRRHHVAEQHVPRGDEQNHTLRRLWTDLGARGARREYVDPAGTGGIGTSKRRDVFGKLKLHNVTVKTPFVKAEMGMHSTTEFSLVDMDGNTRFFRANTALARRKWISALRYVTTQHSPRSDISTTPTSVPDTNEALSSSMKDDQPELGPLDVKKHQQTWFGWAMKIVGFPVHFILSWTIPDVRVKKWESYYGLTFLASMVWLALFSFAMVSSAEHLADVTHIPQEVVGLTVSAAGTSFPNVVAAIIVSRRGLGPMAIANAFGSNVFNIFFALGVPWLAAALTFPGGYVVQASNIIRTVIFLATSLAALVMVLAISRFRIGIKLGYALILAYGAYLAWTVYTTVL